MKSKTGRDAVVLAFAGAYEAAANIGSKIGEVCTIARSVYKGGEVPEDDANYIADKLCAARGWEGGVAKVRASEARKVLHVYTVLPEGIAAVKKQSGSCNWRGALMLATLLKKHENKLKPALAAFYADADEKKANYAGRVAKALKAWYEHAKGDKRKAIIDAASTLNVELGIKV